MRDIASVKVLEMSLSANFEPNDDRSAGDTERVSRAPTLAAILACREASSGIMEHEKTILVMKEHDYAKTPDMSQLAPFFRFLSEERSGGLNVERSTSEIKRKPRRKGSAELFSVRQALADTRASLLVDESPLSDHLNSMVSLQAALINQLQEQVFCKGVETSTIKKEKEQLEARLERMERRLSVLQKRSKQKDPQEPSDDLDHTHPNRATPSSSYHITAQTPPASVQAKPEQLTRLTRSENITSRNSRSRSSSTETVGGRRHSRTGSTSLDVSHRAVKRTLEGGTTTPSAPKKTRSSPIFLNEYLVVDEQYNNLELNVPDLQENDGFTPLLLDDSSCQSNVKVPTWRTSDLSPSLPCSPLLSLKETIEETSDESYLKRHSKPENEEKRRKRWDAQRMRERLKCDQLLRRYMNRESLQQPQQVEKKKDKVTTFLPKLSDIDQIEISNDVVVSAFGRPIPSLKPSVFSLDHFDPSLSVRPPRGRPPKGSNRHSQTNSNNGEPPATPTITTGDKISAPTSI